MGDTFRHDLRDTFRALRAHSGLAAVLIVTLALGIGANTAIFSLVNSLLLRPLPVEAPERLAILTTEDGSAEDAIWSNAVWEAIGARAEMFDSAFAWSYTQFNVGRADTSQAVAGIWTSGNAFAVLGVPAALGRTFTPADDRRGGGPDGPVAVISHAFWQRHFAGMEDAIGRGLELDGIPVTVIGVTPRDFLGIETGRPYDVAVPLGMEPLVRGEQSSWLDLPFIRLLSVMVRLKHGQSLENATALLRSLQPQIREATRPGPPAPGEPDTYLGTPFSLTPGATGRSLLRRDYERPLLIVLGIVSLVLLTACVNIANLLLARASARAREWSVRLALGAPRRRLVRQVLTECLVLSALGAAAGLVLARWLGQLLVQQLSTESVALDLTIDGRVLAYTMAATLFTTLLFGIAPALRVARGVPGDAMKNGTRGAAGGRTALASGFVVAQVTFSLVLVVGAALFIRTFTSLTNRPLGFDSDRVLVVNIDTARASVPPDARLHVFERLQARVRSVPGVATAGLSMITPVSGMAWGQRIQQQEVALAEDQQRAFFNAIGPGWLETYRTPLLAGRHFTERDVSSSPRVALVNQAFARRFLSGASPIGRTVQTAGPDPETRQIVGVVADAVYLDLREPAPPTVYVPIAQLEGPPAGLALSVRGRTGAMASLVTDVSAAVADVNPQLSATFRSLTDQVRATLVDERLLALLSAFFGGLALGLAGVGLYGITSYAVRLRTGEMAIRIALGATRTTIVRLVLGRVVLLVAAGVFAGIVVSVGTGRFVTGLLYGLEPGDPATLAASALVLATVGLAAGWLPARRASQVEPRAVLSDL